MSHMIYIPIVMGNPRPPFDMADYLGDGRIYLVRHTEGEARHQTQPGPEGWVYQTKGWPHWAEYEELRADGQYIYRGTDTSMGNGRFYTLYDDDLDYGSRWCPRYWQPGDVFQRNPLVVVRRKVVSGQGSAEGCQVELARHHMTWIKFVAHYPTWDTSAMGRAGDPVVTLENAILLHWLARPDDTQPLETYYYAKGFGLVAWGDPGRAHSCLAETYPEGQEPDNGRELLACERPPKPDSGEFVSPNFSALGYTYERGGRLLLHWQAGTQGRYN